MFAILIKFHVLCYFFLFLQMFNYLKIPQNNDITEQITNQHIHKGIYIITYVKDEKTFL